MLSALSTCSDVSTIFSVNVNKYFPEDPRYDPYVDIEHSQIDLDSTTETVRFCHFGSQIAIQSRTKDDNKTDSVYGIDAEQNLSKFTFPLSDAGIDHIIDFHCVKGEDYFVVQGSEGSGQNYFAIVRGANMRDASNRIFTV